MRLANQCRTALRRALQGIVLIAFGAGIGPDFAERTARAETGVIADTVLSGISTGEVMQRTVEALPSCLAYQVTGVCFFLKCTPLGCSVVTSIRVAHYVPDVVVSTYHDSLTHPWMDVGRFVASTIKKAGETMMGSLLDSSANTAREAQEIVTFKEADAIGNPIGAAMAGGGSFEFLDFSELMSFPSQELPRIVQLWASVPVTAANQILEDARAVAMNPGALLGNSMALPGQFGAMLGNVGSMLQNALGSFGSSIAGGNNGGQASGGGASAGGGESSGGSGGGGSFVSPLDQLNQYLREINVAAGGSKGALPVLCPGVAGLFSIYYHSEADSVFWHSRFPLDLLYPASWIPGFAEVGSFGLSGPTTWGNIYPRTGELVQSHPVKASAVLATRAANIISQSAQPHIYKQLTVKGEGGYVYFATGINPKWQPVYPSSGGCITFGENDSLNPFGSWGDFNTSTSYGYIWNFWRWYSCCERKTPIFLFALP